MSNAAVVSLGTDAVKIYGDENGCTSFFVHCPADSSVDALLQVQGIHESTEWFTLPIGQSIVFCIKKNGIHNVFGKSASGTATINFTVARKDQKFG